MSEDISRADASLLVKASCCQKLLNNAGTLKYKKFRFRAQALEHLFRGISTYLLVHYSTCTVKERLH
jgi:hypothetical protein